jgi:hypothetical protein
MIHDKQQHDGKFEGNNTDETIDNVCKTSNDNPVIEPVSIYDLNINVYIPTN